MVLMLSGISWSRDPLRCSPYLDVICPSYKPFWYDDGDLLLIVKDHVFRLRRATLSCSEVFRDMFAFAQPSPEESFEDCTVIHLTDEPQDWTLLLQCLDDSHGNFWEKDEPTYDTIASILHLATKYEFSDVRACATAKLHEVWPSPTSLETMDVRAFSPHRADAVALARQCDLPEILPAIFYSLAVDYTHTRPADQRRLIAGAARLDAFLANTLQRAQALDAACRRVDLRAMYWEWAEAIDEEAWDGLCMDCFCSYESFLEMTRTRLRDAIPGFSVFDL
ncbi:hypothetical protein EI94DRAFT_1752479, partial [Lactarius quietus]